MNNALVHIGFHKTGTTFLQKNVFNKQNSLFKNVAASSIQELLIAPSSYQYDQKKVNDFFRDRIKIAEEEGKIAVFSNERLSGQLHSSDQISKVIAERLHKACPFSKILIVIREQKSMIKSAYYHYLKTRGSYSIEEYLNPPGSKNFHFDKLEYHKFIGHYYDLFGEQNVLILPYEMLQKEPNKYLTSIFSHLSLEPRAILPNVLFDKKVNKALKPMVLLMQRYFNPFIQPNFRNTGGTFRNKFLIFTFKILKKIINVIPTSFIDKKKDSRLSSKIEHSISGLFDQSNRKTSKLIGIDLNKYGYEC